MREAVDRHRRRARYLHRITLTEIERRWGSHGFVRVHRQFTANLHHAVELRPLLGGTAELVFAGGAAIPGLPARRSASSRPPAPP